MTTEFVIDSKKISIITPFHNVEQYLPDCIQSILDQSFTNWELILVNDQSSDGSNEVAIDFASRDQRIILLQNTTKGLLPALRLAYQASSGKYITRMDADDKMTKKRLELMLNKLESSGPGSVCVGKVKYFSLNQLGDGYKKYEKWLNKLTEHESNFEGIYRECSIPSPNFLIQRQDFDKIGGFNIDAYPEDYDLAFRMYQYNLKVCSVNEVTLLWRDHSNRSTRTQEHYKPIRFIPLKINYFLQIDYNNNLPLVLWGAGKKGKLIAKELIKNEIDFNWVTENEKKVKKEIYNITLAAPEHLELSKSQVIIAVSNPDEVLEIERMLGSKVQCSYWRFF